MAKIKNLEQLFAEQLQDIYYVEKKLTKALPKMAKKANSPKLSQAILKHLRFQYRMDREAQQLPRG